MSNKIIINNNKVIKKGKNKQLTIKKAKQPDRKNFLESIRRYLVAKFSDLKHLFLFIQYLKGSSKFFLHFYGN